MNQANTLCLVAIILLVAQLANTFCFGLNPTHLGGWGPAMIMTCGPVIGYALGRIWHK